MNKEIEAEVKNLPTKKNPWSYSFMREFYQTFKQKLMPVLLKFFPKNWKEGTLPTQNIEKREHFQPLLFWS